MAIIKTKLTIKYIETIVPSGETTIYRDSDCVGLILRVGASGRKAWAYDYRDPNGKRQTFTFGTTDQFTPGEAREQMNKLRGTDPAARRKEAKADAEAAKGRTLRTFIDGKYWDEHLAQARSGSVTKKRLQYVWADLLDKDMAHLSIEEARAIRQDRLEDEITPQTLNRDRNALIGCLNKALEWMVIDKNPLDHPAFYPLVEHDAERVRWLGQHDSNEEFTLGERARFTAALNDDRTPQYLRDMANIAINTGLRRGELFKLTWANVNFKTNVITVAASTAKTAKVRHIAMANIVRETLDRLHKAAVKSMHGLVFLEPATGNQFKEVRYEWEDLVRRASLTDFRYHDMRHDFASRLIQNGASLYEVAALLGHSDIKMTQRYAHLAPQQLQGAIALLNQNVA